MDDRTEAIYRQMLGLKNEEPLPDKLIKAYETARFYFDRIVGGVFTQQTLLMIAMRAGVLTEKKAEPAGA